MLSKRIIPCLDIKEGRTVKGVNFENLRDAGDPVELAAIYADRGADELVFLDITATVERRTLLYDLVERVAHQINIPFTVGGGINNKSDVSLLLNAGAEKVSVNSAAFRRPELLSELSAEFGRQCIVLAIDTKHASDGWTVYLDGGRTSTGVDTLKWAREAEELGAGEILLTSMNNDGTKSGFALDITRLISDNLEIPVIASGGAGTIAHFIDVFRDGGADAALAASIFHFREVDIVDLKLALKTAGIAVRV